MRTETALWHLPRSNIQKALLVLWTAALVLFRPSVVGQDHNPLVFCAFLVTTLVLFITDKHFSFAPTRQQRTIVLLTLLTMAYFFCQGMLISGAYKPVINSSICIVGSIVCMAYVVNKYSNQFIFKTLIIIHLLFSVSSVVTVIILAINKFNIEAIPVILKLHTYSKGDITEAIFGEHSLLFPFSLVWGRLSMFGINLPRFLGIYRESGLSQIYFWTSYFLTFFVSMKHIKIIRICIFVGAFLTFSTNGILSFALGYSAFLFLNKTGRKQNVQKAFVVMLILSVSATIMLLPGIGILDKMERANGMDRISSYEYSINSFLQNPIIGKGYYYGFSTDSEGRLFKDEVQFIGILGTLYQLGSIGLLLYFACWIYSLTKLANKKTLCIYVPCIITLLFFQPSYNDILVWFLMLVNTKELSPVGETDRDVSYGTMNLAIAKT
jgi:hypothetical protein